MFAISLYSDQKFTKKKNKIRHTSNLSNYFSFDSKASAAATILKSSVVMFNSSWIVASLTDL